MVVRQSLGLIMVNHCVASHMGQREQILCSVLGRGGAIAARVRGR